MELSNEWKIGLDADSLRFINRSDIIYVCGTHICIIDKHGVSSYMPIPTFAAVKLVVHPSENVFALVEVDKINPTIFIYNYPELEEIGRISDFTRLDVLFIEFSESLYLMAITGPPSPCLVVWNFRQLLDICRHPLSDSLDLDDLIGLSICPTNWCKIALMCRNKIFLYEIECAANQIAVINYTYVIMPPLNLSSGKTINAIITDSRTTNIDSNMNHPISKPIELPISVKAGVSDEYFREFLESQDDQERCCCVSFTWSEKECLFIGCLDGQIVKFDSKSMSMQMLVNNSEMQERDNQYRLTSASSKQSESDSQDLVGYLDCMVYTKEGLYIGGTNGILRIIRIVNGVLKATITEDIHRLLAENDSDDSSGGGGVPIQIDEITANEAGPISNLIFNSNFETLAVISQSRGLVHLLGKSTNNSRAPQQIVNTATNRHLIAVCPLPDPKFIASLRDNGLLQIWDTESRRYVSSINVGKRSTSLSASILWNVMAVGTVDGEVIILEARDVTRPRIISIRKLHKAQIRLLRFDKKSQIIVVVGGDQVVSVLSGLVSDDFHVMGTTNYEGDFEDLSVFNNPTSDDIAQIAILSKSMSAINKSEKGGDKLIYFEISPSIINDPGNFCDSVTGQFEDEAIMKMWLTFDESVYGCILSIQAPEERSPSVYAVDVASRHLSRYQIPSQVPKKAGNKASYLPILESYPSMIHDDPKIQLRNSLNYKSIISYGREGTIRLLDMRDKNESASFLVHQNHKQGITDACFSSDGNFIYSCGYDGTICRLSIQQAPSPQMENESACRALIDRYAVKVKQQNSELQSIKPLNKQKDPQPWNMELTWTEQRIIDHQAEEDAQFKPNLLQIEQDINSIRAQIREMVQKNETLDDLEKIDRQEFELDVEMKQTILQDIQREVDSIKQSIELKDLSNQFIHNIIKIQCWDGMTVRGRSLCSFGQTTSGPIEVVNFPLKDRSEKDLATLEMVVKRRNIELDDLRMRKQYTEYLTKANTIKKQSLVDDLSSSIQLEISESLKAESEFEEDEQTSYNFLTIHDVRDYENYTKIAPNFKYLYPQLDLETRDQKMNQIILIKDIIYQIKLQFNKEFNEIFMKKEQEIVRIKDKNQRINKILMDIDQESLIVPDPELNSSEKPEKLLIVEDHEVKVEKYLSEEERKRLEEERRVEEERIRREKLDNWRERGLEDMMGGVLEIRREDELKKDIPKPAFLEAGKPEEDWTDEERKQFEEYDRKVKELNEERDKYKKQLEAEYKKLAVIIDDAKSSFDEQLLGLFNRQIAVMITLYAEEVKILRLQVSLLLDELLEARRSEILMLMHKNKNERAKKQELIKRSNTLADLANDQVLSLKEEEKFMDKSFRKEFNDVQGAKYENLIKLYKIRPKFKMSAHPSTINVTLMPTYAKSNPYSDRPQDNRKLAFLHDQLVASINELDKSDKTRNEEIFQFLERLFKSRRRRIEKEFEVKMKEWEQDELKLFTENRMKEDNQLKQEEEELTGLLDIVNEQLYLYQVNKQIQLDLRQGQVEILANDWLHDFSDSILLQCNDIVNFNDKIRHEGTKKLKHMKKSRDGKRKLLHLEWQLRKMLMEYEDLIRKMREIQYFKITKEMQKYLSTNDYDGLINSEIQKMELTIENLRKHQQDNGVKKAGRLDTITNESLARIKTDNNKISRDLIELNVQVNERRHIQAGFPAANVAHQNAELRYKKIVQRQSLVDLAKSQARQVAVLRSEVERLRMRTFPALVQPK